MTDEEIGISNIINKLRDLLSNLSDDVIKEEIFNKLDTDYNGGLSRSELRQALYNLGLRITINDLDDLMLYFDANGDGSISLEEFLRFRDAAQSAPEISSNLTSVQNIQTRKIIQSLRNSLLGYGDEALKKLFIIPGSERLRELDENELYEALNQLGIRNINRNDVHNILLAMDANNDHYVSYEELSQFLDQERFANGIRTLMSGAARYLRSRGSSLAKVLRKIAYESGSNNGTELSSKALRTLFTDRLHVPLSDGQIDAIIAMADLDGNGYCDVDEILYLADEEDDDNNNENDVNDTFRSTSINDDDVTQLDDYAERLKNKNNKTGKDSKVQATLNKYLQEMGNLELYTGNELEENIQKSVTLTNTINNTILQPLNQLYFSNPTDIDQQQQDYVAIGLSAFENVPLYSSSIHSTIKTTIDPAIILSSNPLISSYCSLPWTMFINMVYARCALPASTAQTIGVNNAATIVNLPPGIDINRLNQILCTMGIYINNNELFNILQRINYFTNILNTKTNTDNNTMVFPTASNMPAYTLPSRIDYTLFCKILDNITLFDAAHKRLRLDPLIESRIITALRYFSHTLNNNNLSSTYQSIQSIFITRSQLVLALLAIPGAYLTTNEAIAIACYAPGIYRHTCQQNLYIYIQKQIDEYNKQNKNIRTPKRNGMMDDTSDEENQTSSNTSSSSATNFTASTYCLFNLYPTDINQITSTLPPRDPDINVGIFINWLRTLAENGGSVQLLDENYCKDVIVNCHPTKIAPNNIDAILGSSIENKKDDDHDSKTDTNTMYSSLSSETEPLSPLLFRVHRNFATLDPLARIAIRKLTSGCIRIPSPLSASSVISFATTNTTNNNNSLVSKKFAIPTISLSSFLLWSHKLPISYRPSVLSAITASHLRTSISSHILDGGFEQDTNGLTLRMASILPGNGDDPTVGCLPSFRTIPDRTTLLRPIGGAGGVGGSSVNTTDITWAAEGETVRSSPTALLTALIQLSIANGIPLPADDQFRGIIVGRNVRVSIMDAVPEKVINGLPGLEMFTNNNSSSGTTTPSPRLRLLSNSFSCPANWENSKEDSWSFPATPVTAPYAGVGVHASSATNGRILLRSDQPRDRLLQGGPAQAIVIFELNLVLAKMTSQANNANATNNGPDSLSLRLRDSFTMEEITCAWGSIPLTTLVEKPGNHRINLTGGIPGNPMDISPTDILRRKTGFSNIVAKTLSSSTFNQGSVLTIQSIPLQKLKKIERINIGKLPLTIVTPYTWIPIISNLRQLIADTILRTNFTHSPVPQYIGHNISVSAIENLLNFIGSNSNHTSIGVLSRALEIELNNTKSINSNTSSTILSSIGLRTLPILCLEHDGEPAPGLNGTSLDDTITRTLFTTPTSISIDTNTIVQSFRTPAAWKPMNSKEQLIGI